MGPFLGAIVAAFLGTLALDIHQKPETVARGPATILAIGMIAFAWLSARIHHARPGDRFRPPVWARPADLLLYGWLLFETDWTTVAREAVLDLPFLRHALVLAPYLLATLARVEAAWPADHVEHEGRHPWTRSRAVWFHAKLLLIPILPLLVIAGMHDAVRFAPGSAEFLDAYPAADYGAMAVLVALAMLVMPTIMKWLFGTKPLAPGPLRDRLDGELARQRIRVGGIEHVDTGGLIPNAAWLGLTVRTGRIFISDALLELLPEDEVHAVVAHEIAHGTRRHLVWLLGLILCPMFGIYVAGEMIQDTWAIAAVGVVAAIAGIAAFTAISRRFEVEADLAAADALGDPEQFNRALTRVGSIAGKPPDRHGMRHWSIAKRTAIVRQSAADPAVRAAWNRQVAASKLGIAALLAVALAGVAWKLPQDLAMSGARLDLRAADKMKEDAEVQRREGVVLPPEEAAGTDADLRARYESILDRARNSLGHWWVRKEAAAVGIAAQMSLADEALRLGRFDEARAIAADVEAGWPRGNPVGDLNRLLLAAQLAAIDPGQPLAAARAAARAAMDATDDFVKNHGHDRSSDWCEQEMRFLVAALEGGAFDFEADSFESSRLLALARGARVGGTESREALRALATWPRDAAWRRAVLERALGNRPPAEALKDFVAAETRRSAR